MFTSSSSLKPREALPGRGEVATLFAAQPQKALSYGPKVSINVLQSPQGESNSYLHLERVVS